jgi:HEAT repeat protein
MTHGPLTCSALQQLLDKVSSEEERDFNILSEKVSFLSRVAVDHLFEDATGFSIGRKAAAIVGLAAHRDKRCFGIIMFSSRSLIPEVEKLLRDPLPMIRLSAMRVLASLKVENLETSLSPLVFDPIWYVREALAEVLGEHETGEGLLLLLVDDSRHSVRDAARLALNHV